MVRRNPVVRLRTGGVASPRRAGAAARPRHERRILWRLIATCSMIVGCTETPFRPVPAEPEPLSIVANVNIQMGDTPVGERPLYIVTGSVTALEGGLDRLAQLDSLTVDYQVNTGPWVRLVPRSVFPLGDRLPITVADGDAYQMRAFLFASAIDGQGRKHRQTAAWLAAGRAISP